SLQHVLQHARDDHDFLRDHPYPRGRVWKLSDSAHGGGQRYGFPNPEHVLVLVHVAGLHHDPGRLLRGFRRTRERLDFLPPHRQPHYAAGPRLSVAGGRGHGVRPDLLAYCSDFRRHFVDDGFGELRHHHHQLPGAGHDVKPHAAYHLGALHHG